VKEKCLFSYSYRSKFGIENKVEPGSEMNVVEMGEGIG
jgi:hypothetical protein